MATVTPLPVSVDVANVGASEEAAFAPHITQKFAAGCSAAPQRSHLAMRARVPPRWRLAQARRSLRSWS